MGCLVGRRELMAAAIAVLLLSSPSGAQDPEKKPAELAVIVNLKNPTTELSLGALRSYFKLDRQYWPGRKPCKPFLRPNRSTETRILLEDVYRMTATELRRYWIGKRFRGEITSLPPIAPTAENAVAAVMKEEGAISVVLASEVPKEGVRVLRIDGKKPGEPGYPLVLGGDDGDKGTAP